MTFAQGAEFCLTTLLNLPVFPPLSTVQMALPPTSLYSIVKGLWMDVAWRRGM